MRRISVEAEISARSYKKLCEAMKGLNRKQLWKILDHYLFHIMEDQHAEELLKILKSFEETNSLDEPHEKKVEVPIAANGVEIKADAEEEDKPVEINRPIILSSITAEDMEKAKDKLPLLFDVNYFTYMPMDFAIANAKSLMKFCKEKSLPIAPHWDLVASSDDFFDSVEDEQEDDGEEEEV